MLFPTHGTVIMTEEPVILTSSHPSRAKEKYIDHRAPSKCSPTPPSFSKEIEMPKSERGGQAQECKASSQQVTCGAFHCALATPASGLLLAHWSRHPAGGRARSHCPTGRLSTSTKDCFQSVLLFHDGFPGLTLSHQAHKASALTH